MITGVNHITLSIKDLDESFHFYTEILGFKPIARWKKGIYLTAGETWIALLRDEKLREKELPEYTHIAFSISENDFEKISERIINSGSKIFQKNSSEGDSLYFIDPNGHKLEIHASDLNSRIKSTKENPYDGMIFYV